MKALLLVAGSICLVLAGIAGADYLATTISTDGSVMLATAGSDENGSFVSRAMALDSAQVSRSVSGEDEMQSDLSVRGSGPILFSDSTFGILKRPDIREICDLFSIPYDHETGEASMYSSGILQQGTYSIMRSTGSDLFGMTTVNGSGMMLLGSQTQGNRSMESRGFVSGNMSVSDLVRYGGRL
ncbi:MAG: hypothetical protein LUQ50_04480 [Methanospirillum sp.]|uniref:hypothetical protein n=1 Tax=Methanospirillum sp. TaxID=45200 RepID=UPI0023706F02|nr:hypothetical protein [Methanospirillum sp.]MDD1728312.1 hypothetical protein [Methanospirillum sp.]